ncbi:uncharacterized protein LOC134842272 [Symsagittifera roscoffensis]|uniref:uncharacterized protein LOC134842272 n=1 Tax=Symsagittifera roscoffensis TaxID=84072 RepID=UPI00307C3159
MSKINSADIILRATAEDGNQSLGAEGGFSLDPASQQLFSVISYTLFIMGSAAFFANLAIFILLLQKPNKQASEILVLCNLVIDAIYALNLAWVGLCNVADIFVDKIVGLKFQCIIRRIPYTFLILASLLLLIIMTLNRYVAVKMPFRYKVLFKTVNVIKYLLVIGILSTLFTSFDLALCILDAHEAESYSHIFTLVWVYVKFLLIGVVAVLMFVMYKSISKQFGDNNFWLPILLPFKALVLCICCKKIIEPPNLADHCASQHTLNRPPVSRTEHQAATKSASAAAATAPKVTTSGNFLRPVIKLSVVRSNSTPDVSNANTDLLDVMRRDNEQHANSTAENSKDVQPAKGSKLDKHTSLLDVNKIEVDKSPLHSASSSSLQGGERRVSSGSRLSRQFKMLGSLVTHHRKHHDHDEKADHAKASAEQKREKKKHHLTTTFFFISVIFIIVSLPSSLAQVMSHWFPDRISGNFSWRLYLITETLYGLNFLLNPYLYSFNNSYIKRRLTSLFSSVLRKVSKSTRRSGLHQECNNKQVHQIRPSAVHERKRLEDCDV